MARRAEPQDPSNPPPAAKRDAAAGKSGGVPCRHFGREPRRGVSDRQGLPHPGAALENAGRRDRHHGAARRRVDVRRGQGARDVSTTPPRRSTERSKQRIAAAAEAWLAAIRTTAIREMRFDAILVAPGKLPRHIPCCVRDKPITGAVELYPLRRTELRTIDLAADTAGDTPRSSATPSPTSALARVSSVAAPTSIDLGRGLDRAPRRGLDAARDFLCGGALLGHGGRDRAADIADFADGVLDGADRLDRAHGGALHAGDLRADFFGGAAVWPASALTSPATTAKPRPASPARAASMVALSASRLVCSAMSVISLTTSPMRAAASSSSLTAYWCAPASLTALLAMAFDWATWRSISFTDADKLVGRRGDIAHIGGGLVRSRFRRARSWPRRRSAAPASWVEPTSI